MARLVRKEERGPMALNVGSETKWIRMCGLSEQPYCNRSHKMTADEAEGKLYAYNEDGIRKEVTDAFHG